MPYPARAMTGTASAPHRPAVTPSWGTATHCCAATSTRPPACSAPTARWSTCSIRRTACSTSRTTPGSPTPRRSTSSAAWCSSRGSGCSAPRSPSRQVSVTGDYRRDERFSHSKVADRIAAVANMRSMAVAPLLVEGEPLGALGAYSSRIDDFGEAEVALLRALADHAAIAIANQRLLERVRLQADELAHRLDAQQTLQRIAARITAIRDPARGAAVDRRLGAPPPALRRRAPDPAQAGWRQPAADRDGRRDGRRHARVAGPDGLPDRRRHQRACRRALRGRDHGRLPRRPAHPARGRRRRRREADGPAWHGGRAAARAGRLDPGNPGRVVGDAARVHASTSWTCCRASPTRAPSPSATRAWSSS